MFDIICVVFAVVFFCFLGWFFWKECKRIEQEHKNLISFRESVVKELHSISIWLENIHNK